MSRSATPKHRKRAKLGPARRQQRSEHGALLDALMQEANDAAMREALGEPQSRRREHVTAPGRRQKIKVYSAGCAVCRKAEEMIRRLVGADHDVEVLDMHQADVARQAARRGINSLPAIVVNGRFTADIIGSGGVNEANLRLAIAT